jgi:hypothetical protein
MTNTYKSTYKTHAKRGLCRFIAGNGPEPKTTGVGDTDCKQKFEDQHVTLDVEKVDCLKCLAKLATASETRRKKAIAEPADDFEPATDADGFAPDQFAAADRIADVLEFRNSIKIGEVLRRVTDGVLCRVTSVPYDSANAFEDISFIHVNERNEPISIPAGLGTLPGTSIGYHLPASLFERVAIAKVAADWNAPGVPVADFVVIDVPDDWTDRDKAAARKYGICPRCHLIKNGDGRHVCPEGDPPATTPEPAPEALIGRVSLEDWQLGLISDQINQRIGNLAGITNLIIEHDDAPAGGDMDLLFHLGQAVDSLEKANAIVRAERDARFSYLVEVAKENAIDAEKEPIFCNSKSKEQLDEIISGVGACLTRPGGVFATIAGREPEKYISTVQDDGQVLIQFAQPINEKQIQRIAAKPYGVEFARAMFSETIPRTVKEEIRRRSGRSWPRFDNSGQPIGQVHPDEFRKAAEEMFDSDFGGFKF